MALSLRNSKPNILFVLTIDTEEEWDWSGPFPDKNFSVSNTQKLTEFQSFCDSIGIRPTYFVDYAVANDPDSVDTINALYKNNTSEIGAHLHPWCTPPYFGKTTEKESHVVNLPIKQVEEKLDCLIELLTKKFNVYPRSFRTGRWGINQEIFKLLVKKGIKIDSSMYPFYKNEYFNCENAPLIPYWPDYNDQKKHGSQRNILEFPISAGFNRNNTQLSNKVHNFFNDSPFDLLHPIGILWHTNILKKIYMSPELHQAKELCELVDFCLHHKHPVIHMYLHSSSLLEGSTGLMNESNAISKITKDIKTVINHIQSKAEVKFCTISEAATLLENKANPFGYN